MKRRLLLVAHHFPPYGGPRSRRWVRLIRHLAPFYDFDVLTVRHAKGVGAYEPLEESSISGNATVYRTYPGPLYGFSYRLLPPAKPGGRSGAGSTTLRNAFKKIFRTVFEFFLVPDKMVEWLPWGYGAARRLVKRRPYDAIISSAFPYSDHVLAYLIQRRTGLPWIADFGDPWAFNDALPFPERRRVLDRRIEAALLKRMDAVVVTTREAEESYRAHYRFLGPGKTLVLPNGYDEEEYADLIPERGNRFRIVYTGIFYKDRGPENLFEALTRVDFDLELVIAGDVPRRYVDDVERKGLSGKVIFLGHCPHARALSLQKGADILLLLGWAKGRQIPAKVFEYIGAGRPILALRSDADDIAARLVETRRRGLVAWNRIEAIVSAIGEFHDLWRRGVLDRRFELGELKECSVGFQSGRLRALIDKVVSESGRNDITGMRERQ